jgi:hypothetical protein
MKSLKENIDLLKKEVKDLRLNLAMCQTELHTLTHDQQYRNLQIMGRIKTLELNADKEDEK